ncbi:MAG: hypothetical protein NVSMB51_17210 [Solirubrobacteraceae bacterium]
MRETALDRVDLLTIDVERAELDVLAGVGAADWPKLRQIVIDVHGEQDVLMRGTAVRMLYATRGGGAAREPL